MTEKKKLEEIAEVFSGQIMSRIKSKGNNGREIKVIASKCIQSDGTIYSQDMSKETVDIADHSEKLSKEGDIVMKLSPPFDAGLITAETAGAVVPSFCVVVRINTGMDSYYLLAALNSTYVKDQLNQYISGTGMTILPVKKIRDVTIPAADKKMQKEIGSQYKETQRKLEIMKRIMVLEAEKYDVIFGELTD